MTWLVLRAIGERPRIFMVALAGFLPALQWGFAKMVHCWMATATNKICVRGRQGSPQGSEVQFGPVKTPGSTMNRRALKPAASSAALWIALLGVLAVFGLGSLPDRKSTR